MHKLYLTLIFIFLAPAFCKAEITLLGFAQERFIPLLQLDTVKNELTSAKKNGITKSSPISNAFKDSRDQFPIAKWEDYNDELNGDSISLAKLAKKTNAERGAIFRTCANDCKPLAAKPLQDDQAKSFYKYFSNDNWGKHFVTSDLLKKSTTEIANKSGVQIHYVTDLNKNKRPELWITFKLMHGEIGYAVYEADEKENNWVSLVNQCPGCD